MGRRPASAGRRRPAVHALPASPARATGLGRTAGEVGVVPTHDRRRLRRLVDHGRPMAPRRSAARLVEAERARFEEGGALRATPQPQPAALAPAQAARPVGGRAASTGMGARRRGRAGHPLAWRRPRRARSITTAAGNREGQGPLRLPHPDGGGETAQPGPRGQRRRHRDPMGRERQPQEPATAPQTASEAIPAPPPAGAPGRRQSSPRRRRQG